MALTNGDLKAIERVVKDGIGFLDKKVDGFGKKVSSLTNKVDGLAKGQKRIERKFDDLFDFLDERGSLYNKVAFPDDDTAEVKRLYKSMTCISQ